MKKHLLILPLTLLWCAAPAADVIVVSTQPTPDNSTQITAVTTTAGGCWMNWSPGYTQIQLNIMNCENHQDRGITGTMKVHHGCNMPSIQTGILLRPGEITSLFPLGNACTTPSNSPLASWCESIQSQQLASSANYTTLPGGQGKCTITLA